MMQSLLLHCLLHSWIWWPRLILCSATANFSNFSVEHPICTVYTILHSQGILCPVYSVPISIRSTLILSSHLCLDLPSDFPIKFFYTFLIFLLCVICTTYLNLDLIFLTIFGEEDKTWILLICMFSILLLLPLSYI